MRAVLVAVLLLASTLCWCGVEAVVHIPQTRELTIVMTAGEQRCFFAYSAAVGDRFMFGYQVRTGHTDFDIEIQAPDQATVFYSAANEHDSENKVFFVAQQKGKYRFCLDNTGHSRSEKVVAINLAVKGDLKDFSKRSDPLTQSLAHIDAYAKAVLQDQQHLRARERDHRDTVESSNTRVIVRAVIEILVMLAMSVGQVY
jgi:hypothetical protein